MLISLGEKTLLILKNVCKIFPTDNISGEGKKAKKGWRPSYAEVGDAFLHSFPVSTFFCSKNVLFHTTFLIRRNYLMYYFSEYIEIGRIERREEKQIEEGQFKYATICCCNGPSKKSFIVLSVYC